MTQEDQTTQAPRDGVQRYECTDCEYQVDLGHWGTIHHAGLRCVECDEVMNPVDRQGSTTT